MKLQDFMREETINAEPRKAPEFIIWVPPSGAAIECPNLEQAQRGAELYAGRKPGLVVAVYQLVGFAHKPVETPDFTPVGPAEQANSLTRLLTAGEPEGEEG